MKAAPWRAATACAALVAARAPALAEPDGIRGVRDESKVTHGQAEFGAGLLVLPGASICGARQAGPPGAGSSCSRSDSSLALSAWPMFRRGSFAAGAGVMLGLTSSTDTPHNDPPDIPRDHTRRYFTMEVAGRYYVPITERLDGWVGVTSGFVVVNDTFQSQKGLTERATIGPRGVTLLTQGYTIGLAVGVQTPIAQNWLVGGAIRTSGWFLPSKPVTDPIGDEASLKGAVLTVDLGVTLAYRSRLVF